jgi:hypothetical protein
MSPAGLLVPPERQFTMTKRERSTDPVIENLDRREMQDTPDITESGKRERPQLRRNIDCGANPEIVEQRKVQRRGRSNRQAR